MAGWEMGISMGLCGLSSHWVNSTLGVWGSSSTNHTHTTHRARTEPRDLFFLPLILFRGRERHACTCLRKSEFGFFPSTVDLEQQIQIIRLKRFYLLSHLGGPAQGTSVKPVFYTLLSPEASGENSQQGYLTSSRRYLY